MEPRTASETLYHAWLEGDAPLPALNAAAAAVLRAGDQQAICRALCEAMGGSARARRCFVWLKDADGPDVFHGADLIAGTPWRPAAGDRALWDACRRALAANEAVEGLDAGPSAAARRSLLAVPLASAGAPLGVLYVEGDLPGGRLTAADLGWCQGLALHAASAVEIARLRDVRERQDRELADALEKYRTAAREAGTDTLTGLANRRSFLDQADRQTAIARRYGAPYAVLLLDIDHFKACNDIYGHAAGDRVLKAVGDVLARSIRQPDLAARYGGEEFVILCPNTDARKAALLAERVRRAIAAARPAAEGIELPEAVTASIGVATFRATDDHVSAVVDRADRALYQAKRAGRNRVVMSDE